MIHSRKNRVIQFLAILASFLTASCVVGPKFNKPAAPEGAGYPSTAVSTTTSAPNTSGGEAQHFASGADISGDWWILFRCKDLSNLIERSLKASPDIKAAQAALTMAREARLAQKGAYYPSVSGSFSADRSKTSNVLSPVPNSGALNYSLYTPQLSISYVPDVFGLNRRTVESLRAQQEQARFALAATHITLSSNIAAAAIQEASLRGQIDATRELISINTNMLKILRQQFSRGYVSRLDVAAQESQLAQVEATLPPLVKQLEQQRDLLHLLSASFPNQEMPEKFTLADLQLPQELPLSLPSQLVEQRPDVRQAEENLHAACAQIGIAVANRIPGFNLTADAGSMALAAGNIFAGGTSFWDLGASVTQPIFDGGTLLHKERAAKAAYIQANEQYRSTVLTAFQNVADTLHALQQDAEALRTASAAKDAAAVTLGLAKKQLQYGYINYLSLLSAEQGYQQAEMNLVQAQANRYADTAALFQALGGGWWNRADLLRR